MAYRPDPGASMLDCRFLAGPWRPIRENTIYVKCQWPPDQVRYFLLRVQSLQQLRFGLVLVCKQNHCEFFTMNKGLTSYILARGGEANQEAADFLLGSRPCVLFKGPSSQAVRHSPGGLCQQSVGSQDAATRPVTSDRPPRMSNVM